MANERIVSTVEGVVSRVNDNGVQLDDAREWLNVSKYARPRPLLPSVGMRACFGLDGAGYIRTIEAVATLDGVDSAPPDEPVRALEESPAPPPDRDTHIMRQAVLNTATAILASGQRAADAAEVVALAAKLEQWVSR